MHSSAPEIIQHLALSELIRSVTNRKTFTPQTMQEMADSITEKGVLQPIIVRPVDSIEDEEPRATAIKAGAKYEIVMGERRYRGSKLAGKADIKAIVRTLNDHEALMMQVIENAQREDPQPLEEAEQYNGLLTSGKTTIEELAAKIGKTRTFIYQRISLLRLPEKAKTALRSGKLSLPVSLLIARIPNSAVAEEATTRILKGDYHGQPFSLNEVHRFILQECMTQLKNAPFDPKDKTLVPEAGHCAACPKRSGNEKELFADVGRADVCTDLTCFRLKCAAARSRLLAKAREEGKNVLSPEESAKLYPHNGGQLSYQSPYIELAEACPFASKKTWEQIVAKLPKTERPETIVAVDKSGTIHELIGRKEAGEAARALNLAQASETRGDLSPSAIQQRKQMRDSREKHERTIRAVDLVISEILQKQSKAKDGGKMFARLLLMLAAKTAHFDTARRVAKRYGFTTPKKDGEVRAFYNKKAKEAVTNPLAFALESLLWENSLFVDNGLPSAITEACKIYSIDPKKIEAASRDKSSFGMSEPATSKRAKL
jgi:ParB/RepB/Spo0J family partition protein